MQILHAVINRSEPQVSHLEAIHRQRELVMQESVDLQDEEERSKHEYWKVKKWALSIVVRIFERYVIYAWFYHPH